MVTVAFPYDGGRFGGSNVSSLLLAQTLRARGYGVHIVTHGEGRTRDEAEAIDLPVHTLPPLSERPAYAQRERFRPSHLVWLPQCMRLLRRLGVDIVHTNDLAMLRLWAVPARASSAGLVAHWRSVYAKSWSVDLGLKLADAVVAVSRL